MDKAQESIVVAALTRFLSHCEVNLKCCLLQIIGGALWVKLS